MSFFVRAGKDLSGKYIREGINMNEEIKKATETAETAAETTVQADETAAEAIGEVSETVAETAGVVSEAASAGAEKPEEQKKPPNKFVQYLLTGIVSTYVMAFFLMIYGQGLGAFITSIIMEVAGLNTDEHPVAQTAYMYIAFTGIWVVYTILIVLLRKKYEYARKICHKVTGKSFVLGIAGFLIVGGMNFICILASWLNGDIELYFDRFELMPLLFLLFAVFVQSSAEELVCRGFVYRRVERRYPHPAVFFLANSLFFALLHLGNNGVTLLSLLNIALTGILFSISVYYTDSLAFAFAGHAGWNYCQSIVFGLPNSGNVFPYSMFRLDASTARDSFFYNVGFGVEGTFFSVIVLVLGCLLLFGYYFLKTRKKAA